jgi:hypothetical protein
MMKDTLNIGITKSSKSILSLQLNMTYVIKLGLLLVGISLIPTPQTANTPVLSTSLACASRIVAVELNNLFLMVGDISSAYLEAFTNEKVCL